MTRFREFGAGMYPGAGDFHTVGMRRLRCVEQPAEIEFVFEPQEEGGYYVYAPDLPGLHTQGDTLEEATANAEEALALYVEALREEGRGVGAGIVRRTLPLPA